MASIKKVVFTVKNKYTGKEKEVTLQSKLHTVNMAEIGLPDYPTISTQTYTLMTPEEAFRRYAKQMYPAWDIDGLMDWIEKYPLTHEVCSDILPCPDPVLPRHIPWAHPSITIKRDGKRHGWRVFCRHCGHEVFVPQEMVEDGVVKAFLKNSFVR